MSYAVAAAAAPAHAALRVTETVIKVLGVAPETVRILIDEIGPYDFAVAGVTAAERNGSAAMPAA